MQFFVLNNVTLVTVIELPLDVRHSSYLLNRWCSHCSWYW